ncbi:MAG: 16S rRNA (guanine(966)-N(2))-methyltransferase RsmD [Acidobacteria bacterium]|nr:16S rRNA (guanine(966)-N(2))-methyltransferase RsmD [Acidobacteriota bacterium]MDA1237056.1 16S rRNA (guanine(966)-N(2))-methyltransferase RsmD [Acidobacteriota bacterium]
MRVIGGKYRRRQLLSPEGRGTRPMLDSMRETLFNILQFEMEGVIFADLYAGTGAVGIEALSRGAKQALFVEQNRAAARGISANLQSLGAESDAVVIQSSAKDALPRIDADIWFVGPPYADHEAYESTLAALAEKGAKLVIAQHAKRHDLPASFGALTTSRTVKIGSSALTFYRNGPATSDASSD